MLCGKRVARLVVEEGRCAGVQTEDGDVFRAREAVVSTIHVKHLLEMAPAECWPDDFRYGVETFDIGVPAMGVYMAADRPPIFLTLDNEERTAVSAGLAGFPEDAIEYGRALADGRYVEDRRRRWPIRRGRRRAGTPSSSCPPSRTASRG